MVIKMLINKEAPVLSVEYTGRDIPIRTEIKDGTVICGEFVFGLQSKNGIFTPHIYSDTASALKSIEIIYPLEPDFLSKNPIFYSDMNCTNDITKCGSLNNNSEICSRTLVLVKTDDDKNSAGIGFLTAHRFYAWILLTSDSFTVHYDMEDKRLVPGEKYNLEKYTVCEEPIESFLERYSMLIGKENNSRPLASVPSGFCSWSCYYGDVSEDKILNCAEKLIFYTSGKANLIQIDDGWQKSRSFPGKWEENTDRFPRGIAYTADTVHKYGLKFGLWLAPGLIDEKSEYYSELKSLVRTDASPMPNVHPFDLDNPEYYELLRKIFIKMTDEYHADYFKLDFLDGLLGKMGAGQKNVIKYKTDYCVAMFRRAMQTIRDAGGDNIILLSCGSPVLECAGIFDIQRVSCDIIWGKNPGTPSYWDIMQQVASTVFHRYFYNHSVFLNDPDGLVVRDYENGDGFDCTYSEALFWTVTVALSGGSVLYNEELENLSPARRDLILGQLPPLGITGRPVNYFEEKPEAVIAELDSETCFIGLFNYTDSLRDITFSLDKVGMGRSMIFDCIKRKYAETSSEIKSTLMNPHSAALFMIKQVPKEPTFLCSTENIFLGQNTRPKDIRENTELGAEDGEKLYAFYPPKYSFSGFKPEIETDDGTIVCIN